MNDPRIRVPQDAVWAEVKRERGELRAEAERLKAAVVEIGAAHIAAQAEVDRLTQADRQWADHVKRLADERDRLRAEVEELTQILDSHRVTFPDRLSHWVCEPEQ